MESDEHKEIVFGNKNVAEGGSIQVNITQNRFDMDKVAEFLGIKPAETKAEPKPKSPRKPKPARIVQDVYKYVWVGRQEGRMRLVQLYQLLIDKRFKMLDPNVLPDDWCDLFKGVARPFTMKWIGKQAHLRYLFKLLIQKKYITFDNKSAKQWEILGSHFLNTQGKPFTDWDSQHDPSRCARTLQMLSEVLNIHSIPPKIDTFADEIGDEMKEFGEWERYKG